MENLLLTVYTFLFGLFFGSFLLVVADRSVRNKSFLLGRSKCNECSHVLSWNELIPVVSFVIQKGKCRHCRTKLSYLYPVAELLTATTLALSVNHLLSAAPLTIVLSLFIISCLLVIIFADLLYEIIPLPAVLFATLATIFLLSSQHAPVFLHSLTGLGSGGLFLLVFLITRGKGMGFGDVIYATFMGILLGFPAIIFGLYAAFVSGALISLVLVMVKKKKLRGGTIPFGPFLVLGTFIMMIWRDEVFSLVAAYVGSL